MWRKSLMKIRRKSSSKKEETELKSRLNNIVKALEKLSPEKINKLEKILQAPQKKAYTITEAAEMLAVDRETIRRNIVNGSIKAFRLNGRGHYRIPDEELECFIGRGK
jgi:excisionase family DNA binding protein